MLRTAVIQKMCALKTNVWFTLKILPSSHSTANWCIMVNVSMWCLPTTAHKEWCVRYYYRNDKESYTFQRQNPFILQHDVHTNIP